MKKNNLNRAVFLDRDGTILNERGYLSDPQKMVFYPGVGPALKKLQKNGFKLIILTNQSGIARGLLTLQDLKKIHSRLRSVLRKNGVRIDGIYFCPHSPTAGCACRKPGLKLPKLAAVDFKLDLKKSFVIGDQIRDVQLAHFMGAKGILVLTGAGKSCRTHALKWAIKISKNLRSACQWIINGKIEK
jgi:histidinol-phosphate phosphatase family protein